MKFIDEFYRTTLFYAVGKNDVEIVKLLLSNDKINVNVLNISNKILSIPFHIKTFYVISSYFFQLHFQ